MRLHRNFLKDGDPALTYPLFFFGGLDRTPLTSMTPLGGTPRGPESEDAVSARERAWREWEERVGHERR